MARGKSTTAVMRDECLALSETPLMTRHSSPITGFFLLLAFCLLPFAFSSGLAQESPAQWMARIFDPASLGITQFPGAVLNRKLSVDAIVLERGGDKRIAIFIIPLDQLKAAASHFEKQFAVPAQVMGADSPFETYTFDFTSGDKVPPKLAGLRVVITRSQFVDNKGQITMEYLPPKK
jgi:hypothetical protein